MHSLRLEKAYPLYGNDISEDDTPFHVGLDRWIRFDKRDFIGREALLRVQERGIDRRWVGLRLQGELPAASNARSTPCSRASMRRGAYPRPRAWLPR